VILSVDMFTLIDEDVIIPFDDLATTDDDKAWMESFYPAFMKNSQTGGKTYGIPFQRSTPVLYWNKEAFAEAGLDPDKFQGLTTQNEVLLANSDGNETNFDDPKVAEALQYLVDLSTKHEVMAPGIIEWGATPKAFFEGQTAMMWTSTGNLTNVRTNAPFDFGTGYVAPRADTWETDEMKAYTSDFPPALVARDQLEYAVAELSTFENQRVTAVFNDALAADLSKIVAAAGNLPAFVVQSAIFPVYDSST